MANSNQRLKSTIIWPGVSVAIFIFIITLLTSGALLLYASLENWHGLLSNLYLWQVVYFTFWQALLSTLLSTLPAILLARTLYRRRFPGRSLILRICAMTLILPVLVTVFGLISVYGRQGWLASLCALLGINYHFSLYGLSGILLAHVFFNLPLATRLLLQALENIPIQQRQIAAQLAMDGWAYFRFIEWPALRRQWLSTNALIFMLCFASFTAVLTLGGGPKATTIELAIYQALSYDYNLGKAAALAIIQLLCCLGLVLFSQYLSRNLPVATQQSINWHDPADNLRRKLTDSALLLLFLLLIFPPLASVVIDGINSAVLNTLQQPALWRALSTSLAIALSAGILCLLMTFSLLWSSRELKMRQQIPASYWLDISAMMILAMPGIVLATGFFLVLNNTSGIPKSPFALVIFTNALMAIPYAFKALEHPMRDLAQRHSQLCLSLNIRGWRRLRWLELAALRRPLAQALAFACVLSVGDFSIIALFGNEQFYTLPYYLYQQIGAYRNNDGAVTALLLLLLCFSIFTLIEHLINPRCSQLKN